MKINPAQSNHRWWKGQLSSALKVLMGLRQNSYYRHCQRLEELLSRFNPLYLDKKSKLLKLYSNCERGAPFGITHHRDQRSKAT
jgi:hypothetical protein